MTARNQAGSDLPDFMAILRQLLTGLESSRRPTKEDDQAESQQDDGESGYLAA
jgi:hypothetical protein